MCGTCFCPHTVFHALATLVDWDTAGGNMHMLTLSSTTLEWSGSPVAMC